MIKSLVLMLSLGHFAYSLTFTLNPKPIHEVSDKFLSVALDCSNIEGRFADFNLTDPYLTKLVGHLAPLYFRIGGTYADRIIFSEQSDKVGASDITFLSSDWLKVYQFTRNAGARLIYDLNSLLRNKDGTWNSENARQMIKFSSDHQMDVDWELGNEPDLYNSLYQTHVDAGQLAKDYETLRNLLNQYEIYKSSYLIGIDMFDVGSNQGNQDYLSTFLKAASNQIHAVTWHQYYFAGRGATEDLFLNPNTFNYLEQRINVVNNVVASSGSGNKVWLGETSSAYNGGTANMSDRFIGTFLWLDKLGLGANLGLDVIIRQTIFHDNYALLDNNYVPNPDWWLSVLYKQLVGTKVLSLTNNGTTSNTIRLYAHCAKNRSGVAVFGFNVEKTAATFKLDGLQVKGSVQAYELTDDGSLYSQTIRLNGDVLTVKVNGDLPDLKPRLVQNFNGTYQLPPCSLVFLVMESVNIKACYFRHPTVS